MKLNKEGTQSQLAAETFESKRLQALFDTQLLDSVPNDRFDNITNLVSDVFKVPIALISLVDSNRQWFLSRHGLDVTETPRCEAFCSHAINEKQLLVINDAKATLLFKDNPLVTGFPNIRFYAGAVIRDEQGYPLGTLCIIDNVPRTFSGDEQNILLSFCELARQEVFLPTSITTDRLKARLRLHLDPVTNALLDKAFFDASDEARRHSNVGYQQVFVTLQVSDLGWINNTHSKNVADEALLEIATRFREGIPNSYSPVIGRVGDNKLCAFISDVHADNEFNAVLQSITQNLTGVITTSDTTVSTSLKLVLTSSAGQDACTEEAYKFTDLALNSLPDKTGIQSCIVSEQDKAQLESRLTIGRDLPSALENNELHLVFQPKVCAHSHKLIGIEALLRWHHKQLGQIPPDAIFNTATDTNLLYSLEQWVLYNTCHQIRQWKDIGLTVPTISVNITGETLLRKGFVEFAETCVKQSGLDGSTLDFEIVEGSVFDEFHTAVDIMQTMIKRGFSFSLDDFGTGFSSLSYLRNLPIKYLKIDKSFVDDIITNPDAATLCGGIISLAKNLGLITVAEGVETESQATLLNALQCDSFQGYYFYKPLRSEDIQLILHTDESQPVTYR